MKTFKLYSAAVRSRLDIRAPYLEASGECTDTLKGYDIWKYQPSVITDEDGVILEDNGL